jgi:hypothetical protein
MKKYLAILATLGLAACGSNNTPPAPPTPTVYTYPTTTQTATAGSTQANAAQTASSNAGSVVTAAQAGNVTNNAPTLSAAPTIPDDIVADLQSSVGLPKKLPSAASVVGNLNRATKSGTLDTGCYTVSGNTITYNNCDEGSAGFQYTVNGTLTATPTSMTWSIQVSFSITDTEDGSNVAETLDGTWDGNLTFSGDTTTSGTATTAYAISVSDNSTNEQYAYTAQIVFKSLDYNQSCEDGAGDFDSGKLDASVTLVVSGDNTFGENGLDNFGIEFTWSGCGVVAYADGTAN